MKFSAAVLVVLLGAPLLVSSTDVDSNKSMKKVVKMLQDMMKDSKKDGEKDTDLYAKFKCYCDDQETEKREGIAEYKKEIETLTNDIDKNRASSSELSTECAQLKQDMADNELAQKSAKTIRKDAHENFLSEEEEMVGAQDSMDSAIDALAAVTDDGKLLQMHEKFMGKEGSLLKLKASVKQAMTTVAPFLTQKQMRTLDSFIQTPFAGVSTSTSVTKPDEIVGILKQMRDTFKDNLKGARSGEKAALESHEKFMKIKEEQFSTMEEAYDEKQSTLGDNEEELGSLTEQLAAAKESLASDEEFLEKLLDMCGTKAKEYEKRVMLRANEEAAISQAVAILNSDEAFATFGKTKSTKGLLQTEMSLLQIGKHEERASVRVQALQLLESAAQKQKSMKIARVAALLEKGNPFDSVLDEIKKMIKIIDDEQQVDEEQKDWCKSETKESEKMRDAKEEKISDLEIKISDLDDAINNEETGLLTQIKEKTEDIKTNHENQAKETAERAKENEAYRTNMINIKAAKGLIKKAIKVLKKYYENFDMFLQKKEEPDAPETFEGEEGGQTEAGGKVIEMLEFIVKETKKEGEDAEADEEEAVKEFEDSIAELKSELAEHEEMLTDLREEVAEKTKLLGEARDDLAKTEADHKAVKRYLAKIKPGCDFIKENFEMRTESRENEKKALEGATDMLKDTPAYKKAKAKEEDKKK